jgi:hypothetical protein
MLTWFLAIFVLFTLMMSFAMLWWCQRTRFPLAGILHYFLLPGAIDPNPATLTSWFAPKASDSMLANDQGNK